MIAFPNTKILIVPDLGNSAVDKAMIALKSSIDEKYGFTAKIVDIRRTVIHEIPDDKVGKVKDSEIIDLCARKLEQLATDESIVWDSGYDCEDEDPIHKYYGFDDDEADDAREGSHEVMIPVDETGEEGFIVRMPEERRKLVIKKSVPQNYDDLNAGAPDLLVIFGRSAMVAGNITEIPVLLIDAKYVREWPWKKQYYANLAMADEIQEDFLEEIEDFGLTKMYLLDERKKANRVWPPRLYLSSHADDSGEVFRLYPILAMSDPELSNTEYLAKTICDFERHDLDMPILDIHRMFRLLTRRAGDHPVTVTLLHPVEIDGRKIVAIENEVNNQYRMPGILLHSDGDGRPIPLDHVHDRQTLAALRDRMEEAYLTIEMERHAARR